MPEPKILEFAPYRLDAANETLVVDGEELALRPKAFALLWHLASNPDVLLTKEDLLDSVWPGRVVTEGGLSELVRELRKVLGDNARQPRYIATIHGRGYRFIAQVSETVAASVENDAVEPLLEPVGRRRELDQLLARYRTATKGKRQIVFLSGEPGIGKTTVVNAFCRRLRDYNDTHGQPLQIARGQCIEQYGAGEAYLPVLEALEQLAQSDADRLAVNALRQHAPTWLRQFPALLDAAEFEEIDRRASGATRERMLREAVNAVEQICRDTTLLLVLEDLHWSDYSTLDFVSYLAQRANEARLMLIATFRPIEVYAQAHPLKNVVTELKARGQCSELSLDCLDQRAVEDYVTARFSGRENAPKLNELAAAVHHRTDGHPLFMINVADYIEGLDFAGVPDSILASTPDTVRDLIAKQFARLSNDERHVLEAASVAGVEFSAASVAAAVDQASLDDIEGFCSSLAERKSFLVEHGESRWPDGIISTRYAFIHALYQNVIYFALPVGRRARLHERIARREENAWGERSQEIAAELAAHFEAARTIKAAVDYYTLAGDKAVRGWADREAIDLFTRALDLLRSEHDTPDRRERELGLLIALGVPLIHVRGYAAEDVGRVYARARELQHDVGESAQILPILWGLWLYFVVRGEHHTAFDVANQLRDAERIESERFPVAHYAWGCSAFWRGSTVDACASFLRVVDFYSPESDVPRINLYSQDPKVVSLLYHGWALWIRGYPDQALASCEEALVWADELRHPFTRVFALTFFAVLRFFAVSPGIPWSLQPPRQPFAKTTASNFSIRGQRCLRGTRSPPMETPNSEFRSLSTDSMHMSRPVQEWPQRFGKRCSPMPVCVGASSLWQVTRSKRRTLSCTKPEKSFLARRLFG